MPELQEYMYCSQQICIPPMYPYVLRQYAKAAIRSQPTDLLRWSAAYFRCLSLGIPPPIKPRLEYPIPREYMGITPGWLKALLYQLQGNLTISFKVLWDRWIGACLRHETLILMLCLAGFTDPMAVPVYRFLAICAAFLTDSLTETMILICEILTEEPEGGSAMITVEVFNDLYRFLAGIDASKPQILINLYFLDSLLGLEEEKPEGLLEEMIEEEEGEMEILPEEEEAFPEEEEVYRDLTGVYSCPDIAVDTGVPFAPLGAEDDIAATMAMADGELPSLHSGSDDAILCDDAFKPPSEEMLEIAGEGLEEIEGEIPMEEEGAVEAKRSQETLEEEEVCKDEEEEMKRSPSWVSRDTITEDEHKASNLQRMATDQIDVMDLGISDRSFSGEYDEWGGEGVFDEDLELKRSRASYGTTGVGPDGEVVEKTPSDEAIKEFIKADEETGKPEEIYCPAVPGIGGIVPPDMVEAVCTYMLECAKEQHGMVMPRNIRHFNCPPLEPTNLEQVLGGFPVPTVPITDPEMADANLAAAAAAAAAGRIDETKTVCVKPEVVQPSKPAQIPCGIYQARLAI